MDHVGIGSENGTGWPNTATTSVDIDWRQGPFARAVLIVDLESACYPFAKWANDPPPAGQDWPAHCDAFDRNLNIFLDDTDPALAPPPAPDAADGGGAAIPLPASAARNPFEIVHAITAFGGPEHLEVDITDLANALSSKHRLRVDLGSFSDAAGKVTGSNAGWTVSARIELTPGRAPHNVLAAIPLFTGKIEAGSSWPLVAWDVPAGATGGRIEYRTSGHGQGTTGPRCVGPAEEFCDRRHQIFVDGAQVEDVEPWRVDCVDLCQLVHEGPMDGGFDYCQQNPTGAVASVRAPRANWCPGSMTAPYSWDDIPALAQPGAHTFSFHVSQILTGGTWMVSAIYYAYGP